MALARNQQRQFASPEVIVLERCAIMALCKAMCVSSKLCAENIDLVFQILESKIEFGVKCNVIISLGDMFNRFPNILNEHTQRMFTLLHDDQNRVRRQTMIVITHLILNDMLKIRGEIVDICMLLEDQDVQIK